MTERDDRGHVHTQYWTVRGQERFESGVKEELQSLERELRALGNRITALLGALALVAFLLPVLAPFIRDLLGVPTP